MPIISVIMPVYKVENYLSRAVDSVLAQSYTDFELILVDDGSPDRSGIMCDEYAAKEERIRVIHKENGGLSDARNAGIEAAQGKYLFFIDSDDVIHPDCLNVLLVMLRRTNAQIAGGNFTRFEGDAPSAERLSATWNQECTSHTGIETIGMHFDGRESLHSVVSSCCKLYRAELFEDVRFPVGRLFEDEFTVYKLYHKASTVAFTEMPLYFYYVNDSGITGTLTLQKRFDEYDAQWERISFLATHKLEELYDKALMEYLRTAKWDLITSREGNVIVDPKRKIAFEIRYKTVFDLAKARGILDFLRDYDYYVLSNPKRKLWWRIKRKILLFGKGRDA